MGAGEANRWMLRKSRTLSDRNQGVIVNVLQLLIGSVAAAKRNTPIKRLELLLDKSSQGLVGAVICITENHDSTSPRLLPLDHRKSLIRSSYYNYKIFLKTTMSTQMFSFKISVEELVAQILMERTVTYTDQQLLKYVLLAENALDEKERTLIDRVFYGMRHGLLKTVN
jgi:hypothetical protein